MLVEWALRFRALKYFFLFKMLSSLSERIHRLLHTIMPEVSIGQLLGQLLQAHGTSLAPTFGP